MTKGAPREFTGLHMLVTIIAFFAVVVAALAAFLFGLVGLGLGLLLVMAAPIAVAFAWRRWGRGRFLVQPFAVAGPVWVLVATMSWFFTSFQVFVQGDAVRWDRLGLVVLSAVIGGLVGVSRAPVDAAA